MDPISITSSRAAQKVSETGRSITIIDGKTLARLPVSSLDDVLKYAASVEVQQRGPAGAQADIIIRGGTFQQVLVLLDGIKINDPITGHFSAYIPIIPAQIERIEILKGPAAAIYGAEAVGGVINIISKTFASATKEKTSHGMASVAAGEYGYISAQANFAHNDQKLHYELGALSNNADGQLLRGPNRGYFHNNTFSGNAAIRLNQQWALFVQSSYDTRDFAAQNFYTSFASDTATEKVNSWWNHLKLKNTKGRISNEFDVSYKKASDEYLYNPVSTANENKSNSYNMQYLFSDKRSTALQYNAGVNAEWKIIRSNDRGDHDNNSIAAFSSLVYHRARLTVNPGLRIVHDKNYGTELLPQANMAYRTGKINLRANAGRAIRSADFTERYNNYNKKFVTGGSIGNPNLEAERSWSYEAGADLLLKKFKFSAAYFYRNQHNVIDYVVTPYANIPHNSNLSPTGTFAFAQNIKKLHTNGIELEATYQQDLDLNTSLSIHAAAIILHSSGNDSLPSFYIRSHAKQLYQQTILFKHKDFGLSVNSIRKVRNPSSAPAIKATLDKDYWVVNMRLSYSHRFAEVYISTTNIGNVHYADLLGSEMPGSWSSAGLQVKF